MSKLVTQSLRIDSSITKIDAAIKTLRSMPRSELRALFQNECVLLNGIPCLNPGTRVAVGDVVTLKTESGKHYKEKPKEETHRVFKIVYEDDWLLVVDKQPGFLSMPGEANEGNTVLNFLQNYLDSRNERTGKRRHQVEVRAVHRLDRDTSGLLVYTKNFDVWRSLKAQFAEKKPTREYDAIVSGHIENADGTFRSYLATDKALNQHSVKVPQHGKLAITHYRVERLLKDTTWLKVSLETGRRNQIRVHFSEAGHPVLGDLRYLPEVAAHPLWKSKFLALHASTLGFIHPQLKNPMTFSSPLPERMKRFLRI